MARPFDICIRGAGITGRTLALLLARERLRVALVAGPHAAGHSDIRAYALNAQSKMLLESLRAWPEPAHATPVLAMQVRGDDQGEVNFRSADTGAEALAWIVDVPALEAQLAQATQFQADIETVAAPVAATLTVVCEGSASQSRAEFGVDFEVTPYAQRAIAARFDVATGHLQCARQWFAAGEILGVLPLFGNSVAIVWSVEEARAQALADLTPADFSLAVQSACHGVYGEMTLTGERAAWPLQLAQATRWVGQQNGAAWALAGDAAHTVHPLSGQGLNLGLADVAELATLIAGRDYWRSVADAKLLRHYERSRKLEAALLAGATDGLQRLFAQSGSFWQNLRNRGMSGFDKTALVKNWVAQRAMGS
jgi:2-polyprenyl-6-methoxyphenol hydroxylase-like FAD-dependent oxidoreductase